MPPGDTINLRGLGRDPVAARVIDAGPRDAPLPIIFLHGLVGLNDHWEDVVRLIRHRYRCVMLEFPLLKLRDDDCSIAGVTALTHNFISRLLAGPAPQRRAIIVGNSFGGHVAIKIAMDHPTLVGGLVLAGSGGILEKSLVADIQLRPTRPWLARKIGELFYDAASMRDADVDRAFQDLSLRENARALVHLSRSSRRDRIEDRMGEVRTPTLLIWGRNDVVTPPEAAERFLAKLPDARIVWFDRCGHAPMLEKPADFAAALSTFADDLARRAIR